MALLLIIPALSATGFAAIAYFILIHFKLPVEMGYITIIMSVIGGAIGGLAILPFITKPMRNILYAVSYKTGEITAEPPVKINTPNHQRTGFTSVLEAIYTKPPRPTKPTTPVSIDTAIQALNHTPCGIVVLNSQRDILFANDTAPITTGTDGKRYLDLEFIGEQSVYDWLDEITDDNITANRQWTRIATTRAQNAAPQAFYDINASYQKGAAGETVIILFDRSSTYAPEEEDLNFISFAAHELRGPITIIRGYLDVLQQELAGNYKEISPNYSID